MNGKEWERRMDNAREQQRAYEERKRKQLADAKSADDLRRIEQQLGAAASLHNMQKEIEADEYRWMRQMQMDMISRAMQPASWSLAAWASGEGIPETPPKPLTEDVIIEAVIGYRAWNVPLFGGGELQSTTRGQKWPTYRKLEAECVATPCTGIRCTCGIYAFKSIDAARGGFGPTDPRYSNRIYGSVSLWGRVLECAHGYRAQYAYPKAILDNGALARQMAGRYGVPLLATSNSD